MAETSAMPSAKSAGWSFRRRARVPGHPILLGIGFVILVMMSGVSAWLVDEAKTDSGSASHTREVQNRLSEMQLLMHRVTSSQYGFVVSGSRSYLDLYRRAVDEVPRAFESMRAAMEDNPSQQERLDQLKSLIETRLTDLRVPVEAALEGRVEEAIKLQRVVDNAEVSLAIVSVIDRMRVEEDRLLVEREREARDTRLWALGVSVMGGLTIVALALLSISQVRRSAAAQREAQRQIETINVSLEEKVQERTMALQTANQEIQRFAYIVSHDLRSPLVNIMGFTAELETTRHDLLDRVRANGVPAETIAEIERGPGKDFDESLGFIKAAIAKMDSLINAILRLSRVGHQEFRPERVDLDAVVNAIRGTLTHQLQETGATIAAESLPTIVTDRLAVEQVFSNLLDNAVKYLRKGVIGEVSVTSVEKGNFVVVRVADNGRGIDAKDRERVFELFRRSGQRDRPGEGIGLAHVRMLVRRLGGRISVDSEIGKGSTFTVILPKTFSLEG